MLKLGEKIISDIYLGDKKIAKAFLGDKLVYQAGKPIFLDYIYFDGASYIDTGIVPVFGDKLEIYATLGNGSSDSRALFSAGTGDYQFVLLPTSAIAYYKYFETGSARYFLKSILGDFKLIECFADGSVSVDGQQVLEPKEGLTVQTVDTTMFIGGRVNKTSYWLGKIGNAKLIASDGTVRFDLRPCIDPKGTVCMYDMVTKKYFYNQGTGTLKASGRFVKSILFDGASYIDTGLKEQLTWKIGAKATDSSSLRKVIGYGGAGGQYFGCVSDKWTLGPTQTLNVSSLNLTDLTVEFTYSSTTSSATLSANGLSITRSSTNIANQTYNLGNKVGSAILEFIGEVTYATAYNAEGVVIQDLRPYVDENSTACFKDLVTGNLFYNKGTGKLEYTE